MALTRRIFRAALFIFLLVFAGIQVCFADDLTGRLGISFGWPYLGVKYGASKKLTLEARGASGQGIQAWGGRGYYNFNPRDKTVFYAGTELDLIKFNIEGIKGKGTMIMPFVGGETFLSKQFGVSLDFGAAYISLKGSESDSAEEASVGGLEFIVNIGLNYYFGN